MEKKFILILTFAFATPFLSAHDPPGSPDPLPTPRFGNPEGGCWLLHWSKRHVMKAWTSTSVDFLSRQIILDDDSQTSAE